MGTAYIGANNLETRGTFQAAESKWQRERERVPATAAQPHLRVRSAKASTRHSAGWRGKASCCLTVWQATFE